jgi:parallel beta-helix repeat protein
MKRIFALLIVSMLVGLSFVEIAGANASSLEALPSIEIQSDGKVVPQNSPIKQVGNTYYLTSDIYNKSIHIQKDNIILDGAGYKLQNKVKEWYLFDNGLIFSGRSNIVIMNMIIEGFENGISLHNSNKILIVNNRLSSAAVGLAYCNDCCISSNTLSNSDVSIIMGASSQINITSNNLSSNKRGIVLMASPDAVSSVNIMGNNFSEGRQAIEMTCASNVLITENVVRDYQCGIQALSCKGNINVYYNDFINNNVSFSKNQNINKDYLNSYYFDNGTQGNYWSNYDGTDINNDGIGDTPYTLAGNSTDYFPLVKPVNTAIDFSPTSSSNSIPVSPSPTVPEFSWFVILPLLLSVFPVAMVLRHRKTPKFSK